MSVGEDRLAQVALREHCVGERGQRMIEGARHETVAEGGCVDATEENADYLIEDDRVTHAVLNDLAQLWMLLWFDIAQVAFRVPALQHFLLETNDESAFLLVKLSLVGEELLRESLESLRIDQRKVVEEEAVAADHLCVLHVSHKFELAHLAVQFLIQLQIVEAETIVCEDVVEELLLFHARRVAIQFAIVCLRVAEAVIDEVVDQLGGTFTRMETHEYFADALNQTHTLLEMKCTVGAIVTIDCHLLQVADESETEGDHVVESL